MILFAMCVCLPLPVAADESVATVADLSFEELLEVKVTIGSLFPKEPLTSGVVVSEVRREDWLRRGSKTTFEAAEQLPSVDTQNGFGGFPFLRIRNSSAGNSVGLKVDGVSMADYSHPAATTSLPNLELGVLDSIQVVRGPGSALHGADAFHGVVQLQTFQSEEDVFEARGRAGSFNYRQTDVRLGTEIVDGWRSSTAASYSGLTDENVDQVFTDSLTGESQMLSVPGQFDSASVTQRFHRGDFDALFLWSDYNSDGFQGRPELAGLVENGAFDDGSVRTRLWKVSDTIALSRRFDLDVNMFYWDSYRFWDQGNTAGGVDPGDDYTSFESREEGFGVQAIFKREVHHTPVPLNYAFGYAFNRSAVNDYLYSPTINEPAIATDADGLTRRLHSGLFEIESLFLDRDLRLSLGGRYDEYSDFGGEFSPRASLVYLITDSLSAKLNYGHAFRAPAATEQTDFVSLIGGGDLNPETVDTYEVGMIFEDGATLASLTGYLSYIDDGIIPVAAEAGDAFPFRYANIEKRRSRGVEFEMRHRAVDSLELGFSASYNIGEQSSPVRDRNDFSSFPTWLFHSDVTAFFFEEALEATLVNRVEIGQGSRRSPGTVSYVNSQLTDLWRTDMRFAWNTPEGTYLDQLFLEIQNLFDRDDFSPSFTGVEKGLPEPGISAVVGLKVQL
jgi:iron complex outermembrane receptor protein